MFYLYVFCTAVDKIYCSHFEYLLLFDEGKRLFISFRNIFPLCVCVYVCIYIYIYIYTHTHTQIPTESEIIYLGFT